MIRSTVNGDFEWQRNYYEHVICKDETVNCSRQYIQNNPGSWQFDRENPAATNPEPEDAWRTQVTHAASHQHQLAKPEVKHGQLLGKYYSR